MSTERLLASSLRELATALAEGRTRAEALAEAALERAQALQERLNAFITLTPERAREAARAADEHRRAGNISLLSGIPIAHKDLFCTKGVRTTAASRMLAEFVPPYDAFVVERLAQAGAVSLGKTNLDEFAMGSANEHSYFGPCRNPWDTDRIAGGSSGGSAAAVAAGIVPVATGTDTGGSVRQPAAMCGVTGIKPSYGRVSRYGIIAYASSLDQAGVIARSAEDCALALTAIEGFDPRDSTSLERPVEDHAAALAAADGRLDGLRLGLPREFFAVEGLDADVRRAVEEAARTYEALGARLVEVSLPRAELAIPAYYVIAPAEASSNLARYDGVRYGYRAPAYTDLDDMYRKTRAQGFGEEVKRRILVGTYVLSHGYYDAYYLQAQKLRRLIAEDYARAFASCDLLLAPTAPTTAWRLGEKGQDPVQEYLQDIYTIGANLAGLPALSHPCGFDAAGLPIGCQLIGPYLAETRLLLAAHVFQQKTDWHRRLPPL